MKKVSTNPKITPKTQNTLAQTQTININSPKGIYADRGFKNDHKKASHKNDLEIYQNKCKKITKPISKS